MEQLFPEMNLRRWTTKSSSKIAMNTSKVNPDLRFGITAATYSAMCEQPLKKKNQRSTTITARLVVRTFQWNHGFSPWERDHLYRGPQLPMACKQCLW